MTSAAGPNTAGKHILPKSGLSYSDYRRARVHGLAQPAQRHLCGQRTTENANGRRASEFVADLFVRLCQRAPQNLLCADRAVAKLHRF
jgi:hypothetical protein